jgi:hypothetical protein
MSFACSRYQNAAEEYQAPFPPRGAPVLRRRRSRSPVEFNGLGGRIGFTLAHVARSPLTMMVGVSAGSFSAAAGRRLGIATMSDIVRTRKRRVCAPGGIARYGDTSGSKNVTRDERREDAGFTFSSEGLALIGLRRRNPLRAGPKRAIG